MSFDLPIKVDPGDSLAKISGVEDGLARTEEQGRKAAESMHRLSGAFGKLREALTQEQAALARSAQLHDRLTTANTPLVRGMGELARQLQRERDLLERIHGPAREYAADIAALDKLHERGKISTAQYADEVTRLNRALSQTPRTAARPQMDTARASATIGFPNGPAARPSMGAGAAAIGGYLGIAGAAAAPAMFLAAGQAIEDLVLEAERLEDGYIKLSNQAAKFTHGGQSVNAVLAEQTALAQSLHQTLGPTMNVYDAVEDATANLLVTHQEQLRLTETLGKASLLAGKEVGAAAGAFQSFAVALETGHEVGRNLRGMMKEYPELVDLWARSLGVTSLEFVKLGEEGKLSLDKIVEFSTRGGSALRDFDTEAKKIQRTNEQTRAQLMEQTNIIHQQGVAWEQAGREAVMAMDGYKPQFRRVGIALQEIVREEDTVRGVVAEVTRAVGDQAIEWKRVEDAAAAALRGEIVSGARAASESMRGLSGAVSGVANALASEGFFAVVRAADPWFVAPATVKKLDDVGDASREAAEDLRRYREEMRKAREEEAKFGMSPLKRTPWSTRDALGGVERAADPVAFGAGRVGADFLAEADRMLSEQGDAILQANRKAIEMAEDQKRAAAEVEMAWASGLGSIGADLLNMAAAGELSFDKIASSLAKLALQIAAMQIDGPGGAFLGSLVGGLGGGKTGFDHLVGSARGPELPGFRYGGDALVMGSGAPDSKLAMFRVTPGESIHVRTPEQRAAAQPRSSPARPTKVVVNMQNDRRDLVSAMDSRDGERVLVRLNRKFRR